jgi:hypothetical protein
MDIDITPIDNKNVDIPFFLKFAGEELKKHISLVKNRDYKKIAFATSNKNNFKRFFGEIIPLMFFLEREKGIYSKIKYMSGDQKGDATLDNSITIEITKAQNENKYLVTQDMLNHGYAFSPKNIQNKISTSSPTKTQPYVHTNDEHIKDVALYIRKAIENKLQKNYYYGSILIISFESDTSMLECDGDYSCLEKEITNFEKGIFSKIYIIENFLNDDLQPKWQFML